MGMMMSIVLVENYNFKTKQWTQSFYCLNHSDRPFASGGTRDAFHAYIWLGYPMVLKVSKYDQFQDEESGKKQVIMQATCAEYAHCFNNYPFIPKHVSYVPSQLVKFLTGIWAGKYATLEPYIGTPYIKHNTVDPMRDGKPMTARNTPQAFSHFTFEMSGKTEIVVDIQGVGDCYTDPQIYSICQSYGPGDWGMEGIKRFLMNHQCNEICNALRLTPTNWPFGETGIPLPGLVQGPMNSVTKPLIYNQNFNANAYTVVNFSSTSQLPIPNCF